MRLINVHNYKFSETWGQGFQKYAILSHTWVQGQEVSYQDWQRWLGKRTGWQDIEKKTGFAKIMGACATAAKQHGIEYIWVDTNCIDKTSSAELSEAINSMYTWYSRAEACIVFLSDYCEGGESELGLGPNEGPYGESGVKRNLEGCRWFTRGWTLQELLAPPKVIFYTQTWQEIGTKPSLASALSSITGIGERYLLDPSSIRDASVARRMSWAATRQTTRLEDAAYSLLGIFDINMPLLYGEGDKAFQRLQEEILKVSTDQSIFAWEFAREEDWFPFFQPHPKWVSLLAPKPICFTRSGAIEMSPFSAESFDSKDEIYSMTNLGLRIQLPIFRTGSSGPCYGVLRCGYEASIYQHFICVPLLNVKRDVYVRRRWPAKPLQISTEMVPKYDTNMFTVPTISTQIYVPRWERGEAKDTAIESFALTSVNPGMLLFLMFDKPCFVVEDSVTIAGADYDRQNSVVTISSQTSGGRFAGALLLVNCLEGSDWQSLTVFIGIEWKDSEFRRYAYYIWDAENSNVWNSICSSTSDISQYRLEAELGRHRPVRHLPGDQASRILSDTGRFDIVRSNVWDKVDACSSTTFLIRQVPTAAGSDHMLVESPQ